MSGIFGLWRLDGRPVAPEDLERMSGTMRHRGPDGTSLWLEGPVGLGHAALDTTREARLERQPLVGPGGDHVLVCDVRIDYREELLSSLGISNPRGRDTSDAELLLASHLRWGDSAPRHVLGDRASVMWSPTRQELICVRDPFGVRPLYYAFSPHRFFAFASEIQALLALEEVSGDLDEDMIARHLGIPVGDDSRRTYYRHVHRVLPAHVLKLSARGLIEEPYWEIDLTRELRLSSVEEYAEALRESFTEAVRCRMRAATPVACMLSGGIDSVAITCTAARRTAISGDPPIHTLSAVYPSVPESDERSDIEEILAGIAAIPHFFAADATDPIAEIDRMNGLAGGAIRGRNLYLNWELARVAGSEGARVVLDGFDGDSVVSHGIGYLNELAIAGRWCKLARVSVAFSRRRGTPPLADLRSVVRFGRRTRRQLALDSAAQKPSLPSHLPANAHFASGFSGRLRAREWNATEREIHGRHLQSAVLREALGWVEACGAGRQVEVRFPFFDVRVAELCVSMPAGQKLRRGWTRFAMRKAMEGIVPSSVQWRSRKANMHAGWNHAYRKHQTGRVRALLSDPNSAVRAFLDPDRVRELHDRFIAGEASQAEEAVLWTAISLALWLSPQAGEAAQAPGSFSSIRPRSMRSEQ